MLTTLAIMKLLRNKLQGKLLRIVAVPLDKVRLCATSYVRREHGVLYKRHKIHATILDANADLHLVNLKLPSYLRLVFYQLRLSFVSYKWL